LIVKLIAVVALRNLKTQFMNNALRPLFLYSLATWVKRLLGLRRAASFKKDTPTPGTYLLRIIRFLVVVLTLSTFGVSAQSGASDVAITQLNTPRNLCGAAQESVVITAENLGTQQVTAFAVAWTIDGVVQTPYTFSGTLDTAGGAGSTSAQLTIGTFIPTAASHQLKIWSSMPNGFPDLSTFNDTLTFSLETGLSGVYTLDPTGSGSRNFTSFTAAGDALNSHGLCGPTTINISPGTYTGHLFLQELARSSATNTLTLNGGDSSLVHLTYSSTKDSANIFLLGTDYVNIRNMTLSNTSNGDGWNIMFFGISDFINIDSCKFVLPIAGTSDMIHIIATDNMGGESAGDNANYVSISYNTFIGGESAVSIDGQSDRPYNTGHVISHNKFRYQEDHAIDMDGLDHLTISYNDIDSLMNSGGDAVYLGDLDNYTISYNRINSPDWGIYFNDGNDGLIVSTRSNIVNNMILSETDRALYLADGMETNIYSNTMKGLPAIRLVGQVNLDMRNNIFYSEGLAIDIQDGLGTNDIVDYNLYYSEAGTPFTYAGLSYSTLQEWRAVAEDHNQSSIVGNPFFLSSTDLHLTGWFADGRGDTSVPVQNDIDGDVRSTLTPDIGADEYLPNTTACDSVTGLILNNVTSTSANISFDKDGDTYQFEWVPCGFARGLGNASSGTSPISISGLQGETCYDVYVRRVCTSPSGTFYTSWEGPYSFKTLCGTPLNGTYTINKNLPTLSNNFQSFSEAAERLFSCGINGPVTFNVSADSYSESMVLNEISGNNATNTITFNGVDTASTIISHDGSVNRFVISIKGTDYLTFKNIKIVYTAPDNFGGYVIGIENQSEYVTISNCAIVMSQSDVQNLFGTTGIVVNDDVRGFGHDLEISNNVIKNGRYGVSAHGTDGVLDSNVFITNNIMVDNIGPGLYSTSLKGLVVINNLIYGEGLIPPVSSTQDSKSGIWLRDCKGYNLQSNAMRVNGAGIRVHNSSATPSLSGSNNIVNNMITSNSTGESPALFLNKVDHVNVYHNSVYAQDTLALFIEDLVDVNFENNIFASDSNSCVASTYSSTSWSNVALDYNAYYHDTSHSLAIIGNSNYSDLNAWQLAAPTLNLNSVYADPQFNNSNDLHANSPIVNNAGNALNVLMDIDGDIRSTLLPDIGADEFVLPCVLSTNGMASSITPTNAQLSWTAGGVARAYNLQFGLSGFTLGSGTEIRNVSNPHLLAGLIPGTSYDFYVEDSCGTDGTSGWAGPFTFSTAGNAPCTPSTTLGTDQNTTYGTRLFWSGGGAGNWNIEYGPAGFTPGGGTFIYNTLNDTITLSNLAGNTCYDFYVQDSCGLGYVSTWSGPHNFCTQTCSSPTALGADQITSYNARLYWTGGGAANWNIEYGPTGFNLGTGSYLYNNQNDTLVLNNIFGNTCYDYYVQDSCGTNSTSTWAGPYNFCTLGCTANAGSDTSIAVCLTDPAVNLTPFLGAHDAGGTWVDLNNSGNLSGNFVAFGPGSVAGTFQVAYVVSQAGCPNDTALLTIQADAAPQAGSDVSLFVCDTVSVDLDTLLSGQDPGGSWIDLNNSGGLTGSVVDFSLVAHSNTYVYQYVLLSAGCGNDTADLSVRVDSCKGVGIAEYGLQNLAVYPNPSNGLLHIAFTAAAAQAQLYLTDLSGQVVYEEVLTNLNGDYKGSIDVHSLASGTYLLTIEHEGTQSVVRVVKE
jgi:hypothetical protein